MACAEQHDAPPLTHQLRLGLDAALATEAVEETAEERAEDVQPRVAGWDAQHGRRLRPVPQSTFTSTHCCEKRSFSTS